MIRDLFPRKLKFETGEEVMVTDGEHMGKYAVVSYYDSFSGLWVIQFYNGNQTMVPENLLERVPE